MTYIPSSRAKVWLDEIRLRKLLNLPDDVEISSVEVNHDPMVVYVHLLQMDGKEFPHETYPNAEDQIIPFNYFQQGKDAL